MPPPPTIPMTEAERMSDSNRRSTYERKFGRTCGATPKAMTCSRPAPTAATPSTWPGSTASIVSDRSLPRIPPVWMPSASMPANGPRPTAVTNMSANTNSLTARSEVHDRVRAQVARAEEAERHRDQERQHGAPERDAEGDHALPRVLADVAERWMQITLEEHADVADVAHELERSQLDDARREPERDRQRHRREHRATRDRGSRGYRRHRPGVDRREPVAHDLASSPSRSPSGRPGSVTNSPKISNSAASVSCDGAPSKTSRPAFKPRMRSA